MRADRLNMEPILLIVLIASATAAMIILELLSGYRKHAIETYNIAFQARLLRLEYYEKEYVRLNGEREIADDSVIVV